ANAQVGVARAAYFPIFTLTGTGGFEGTAITTLIQGPSGFLTAGAAAAVTPLMEADGAPSQMRRGLLMISRLQTIVSLFSQHFRKWKTTWRCCASSTKKRKRSRPRWLLPNTRWSFLQTAI